MTRLLVSQNVMPEWRLYMESFGLKDFPLDEGYSGFDMRFARDNSDRIACFGTLITPTSMLPD